MSIYAGAGTPAPVPFSFEIFLLQVHLTQKLVKMVARERFVKPRIGYLVGLILRRLITVRTLPQ